MLVQSLVDIGSVLLEKQMKMWKCNKAEDDNCYNNGNNDNTEKLTRALSLGELKCNRNDIFLVSLTYMFHHSVFKICPSLGPAL